MAKFNFQFTEGTTGPNRQPAWVLNLNGGWCKGWPKAQYSRSDAEFSAEVYVDRQRAVYGQKAVAFEVERGGK